VPEADLCLALTEKEFPARSDELGVGDELKLYGSTVSCAKDTLVVIDAGDTDRLTNGAAVQHGLVALLKRRIVATTHSVKHSGTDQ
jgi:hypothetical protein